MRQSMQHRKRDRPQISARQRRGRPKKNTAPVLKDPRITRITMDSYWKLKDPAHPEQRLLGDLTAFQEHWDASYKCRKHPNKCYVCDKDSYHKCQVCGVSLHMTPLMTTKISRFIDYQNGVLFGLARGNFKFVGALKADWQPPTTAS